MGFKVTLCNLDPELEELLMSIQRKYSCFLKKLWLKF